MKNSNQILSFNSLITDNVVPDPLGWSLIFESNKMNFINEGSHQTGKNQYEKFILNFLNIQFI